MSWGDNPLVTAFGEEERVVFRLKLAASTFRAVPSPAGAVSIAELDRGLEMMEVARIYKHQFGGDDPLGRELNSRLST